MHDRVGLQRDQRGVIGQRLRSAFQQAARSLGYRDKEEEASWRARDPIDQLRRQVVARELATDADIVKARQAARELAS